MSDPSNPAAEPSSDGPAVAGVSRPTRPFYWSVRRELWEHPSLYVAPLIAAGVVMFGFLLSLYHLPRAVGALAALAPARQADKLAETYGFAALAVMVTGFIVVVFYCLGALHNERRDRSILFWKSLPVSDLKTVLSKAVVPLAVLPLIACAIVIAMNVVMLLLSTLVLTASGVGAGLLWTRLPLPHLWLVLIYGMAVFALWFAPVYAWLLLVSVWARRAPFLWAVLPPLGLCLVEKIAFDTNHFLSLLHDRFIGGFVAAFVPPSAFGGSSDGQPGLNPLGFLSSGGLWGGLIVAAGFLALAVWLRRNREPI